MSIMRRNWKKDEFTSPDIIWDLDMNGTVIEKVKGKPTERKVDGSFVKLVYMYLVRTAEIEKSVFPSYITIAKHTQLSKMTVIRCIKVLESFFLIEKTTRKRTGKKDYDSNVYLINHPKYVEGLKYLDVVPHVDKGSTPRKQGNENLVPHVDKGGIRGDTYKDLDSVLKDSIKDSVCNESWNDISRAWKECFQESLSEIEFINLVKRSSVSFLLETVILIKKHHDISSIKSPFAFVSKCIDIGGYIVKEKPKRTTNTKNKKSKPLPKAVKAQLDSKRGVETPREHTREELARKRAEIERKIKELYADSHTTEEAL